MYPMIAVNLSLVLAICAMSQMPTKGASTISVAPEILSTESILSLDQQAAIIKECQDLIERKMASDRIVGVSAAVILNDSVVWKKGFGYADKAAKLPMTVDTLVNIGSVTKTFTALSVLQLHDQGLIDITQPISKYLPQFHPKQRGDDLRHVTIKSILTHTSGIQSDFFLNSDLDHGKYTDVLGFINGTYLLFPAGQMGLYSNPGYNILGNLVKDVSGMDYTDYVHRNIFTPLGMTNSGFATDKLQNRTRLYAGDKEVKEYELRDIASGGIYTNIDDFVKYAKGMLDAYSSDGSPLLSQRMARQMFTLQNDEVPLDTSHNKKGLGWFMFKNDASFALIHQGSAGFAQASIILFPAQKAAFIILINTASGASLREEFCLNVLHDFQLTVPDLFPKPVVSDIHDDTSSVKLSSKELAKHVGNYAEAFSYSTIRRSGDGLVLKASGKEFKLRPLTNSEFMPEVSLDKSEGKRERDRYCFKDVGRFHVLIHKVGAREDLLGYRLNPVLPPLWRRRVGVYEHFGYQMLAGDSQFKSADLTISEDGVLIVKLATLGSPWSLPLEVVSKDYAVTAGLVSGIGYTVKFSNSGRYDVIEFAGITFRKFRNIQ